MKIENREQYLIALGSMIQEEIISPNIDLLAPKITYSLTSPKRANSAQILGECWNRQASPNNDTNAIFITAALGSSDSLTIAATLVHEILHAYDNNVNKHNQVFKDLCQKVGLEGGQTKRSEASFTATIPNQELKEKLLDLIEYLGEIPHDALDQTQSGKKKQTNRQLLVHCTECEFRFRTSQKAIDSMKYQDCMACDTGQMIQEIK